MNTTAAITGLALLCATALPAQGERKAEAPPKKSKILRKADADKLNKLQLERMVLALRKVREGEGARAVDRAEVLRKAHAAIAVQLRDRAIAVEKELVVPRANGVLLRAWLAKQTEAKPSPLMKGEYQKAVEKLEAAQQAMRTAQDPEAAMRAIDEASKALMEARAAAWKQKEAEGEKGSETKKKGG